MKVTFPDGTTVNGAAGLTVAVKLTAPPVVEGLADEVRVVVVGALTDRYPTRPCVPPFGPAVKKRKVGSPIAVPLPKIRPCNPSIATGLPSGAESWPRKAPVVGSKALIRPSPKLATRRALGNC